MDIMKMRYSIEPRDRRSAKSYGLLAFAKNIKYSQKLVDGAIDALKTASERAIQKTAEATGDLIGNKIADKIISTSKKSSAEFFSTMLHSNEANTEIPKERYISPQERQPIIDEL